ncbi:MAG: cation:proton antiporter, partial [Weeksellaceae bacterium]|nr:cation:proton antiporter [Weeksellaceae bacterium]
VGYNEGILDEGILNGTIILILVTCVVASFSAEKAAKKIALSDEESLSTEELKNQAKSEEQILIPVSDLYRLEPLLDFALTIKDKNSNNPIFLLSIVPNNDEAEANILKYKKELEKFQMQGSATETDVSTITRIDYNLASGIGRTAKEIMADMVVLSWPERQGIFDYIFGERIDAIIKNVDRSLVFCRIKKPLIEKKRLVFICPPHVEREKGFKSIVQKIMRISQEYTIPISLYSENITYDAIQKIMKELKLSGKINPVEFTYWEDFLIITKNILPTDLIVFVAARRGAISHSTTLEKIPQKFEKYLPENSQIVIYPMEDSSGISIDDYDDYTPDTLNKGIESIEKIGKGLGGIFKRKTK